MELINPYAVLRNTATHEAYKAYSRRAAMAGQPFISLALLLVALAPASALIARVFLHVSPRDWWVAFWCYLVPVTLAGVFMVVAAIRMLAFRKANPIPDEWRQIPRSNPLRFPGRTPLG